MSSCSCSAAQTDERAFDPAALFGPVQSWPWSHAGAHPSAGHRSGGPFGAPGAARAPLGYSVGASLVPRSWMKAALVFLAAFGMTAAGAILAYVAGMRRVMEGDIAWGQVGSSALCLTSAALLVWTAVLALPGRRETREVASPRE